ncbi:MAG: hypothetical protein IH849_08580 [Acidobacteria bacterium]|nr:hypothetical protein [Acidobacteriota bacterium]
MDQREISLAMDQHMVGVRAIPFALTSSVLIYLVVGWLLAVQIGVGPLVEVPTAVIAAVVGAGLVIIFIGYAVSRWILGQPVGPNPEAGALMQRYIKAVVMACALREVAVTVGFALSLFTANLTWVLVLGGAAMISMALHWPRRDAVEDWMQQQQRRS